MSALPRQNVRSSVIHNGQKEATTQTSLHPDEWIGRMGEAYNGVLFTLRKEETADPCSNMNEP